MFLVLPPTIHGPFIPNYPTPKVRQALGSPNFIYNLFALGPSAHFRPFWQVSAQANVKDIARAHVDALSTPPLLLDGTRERKRLIVYAGNMFWTDVIDHIREKWPQISDRLVKRELVEAVQMTTAKYDSSFTNKVLGWSQESYIDWKQTVDETVDTLLKWESATKQ